MIPKSVVGDNKVDVLYGVSVILPGPPLNPVSQTVSAAHSGLLEAPFRRKLHCRVELSRPTYRVRKRRIAVSCMSAEDQVKSVSNVHNCVTQTVRSQAGSGHCVGRHGCG